MTKNSNIVTRYNVCIFCGVPIEPTESYCSERHKNLAEQIERVSNDKK